MATASYDAAVKLVAKPYLLTHRIDPRVDRERDLIASDLQRAGARELAVVTVTGPTQGHNAGGDNFTTDGRPTSWSSPDRIIQVSSPADRGMPDCGQQAS